MKFSTVAKVWLWELLAAISVMVTEATPNQLVFRPDDFTIISIRFFNDGRPQPYRLFVKDPPTTAIYTFQLDGRLTSYKQSNNGGIYERFLVDYNEQTGENLIFIPTEVGMPTAQDLPAPFACDDCEMVWNDMCEIAEPFCGLFGFPISYFTFGPLCSIFRSYCNTIPAEEACGDSCVI